MRRARFGAFGRVFADEDAVAFGVLAGHDRPEALPEDALDALSDISVASPVYGSSMARACRCGGPTNGMEITAAEEEVVADVVVVTRVIASQHLAGERQPGTTKRHGDVEPCLLEPFAKGREEMEVLDGADQSKFHVGQRRGSADGIEEALLRFFFGERASLAPSRRFLAPSRWAWRMGGRAEVQDRPRRSRR